ncbi:MAG: tRNA 2-thiouridine(34) synthase MnmA [Phycisphaerae bacterium]
MESRELEMVDRKGKVVVAMSGGVDSSVAACLLQERGYEVIGLFMWTGIKAPLEERAWPADETISARPFRGCCSAADADDARKVAGRLGIPLYALDFKESFESIIDHFVAEYVRGRTPNPCVLCNDQLKFGRLAEYGLAAEADFVATGHYARVVQRAGQSRLCRGVDRDKDQSYVLFQLDRGILRRVMLPIGEMTKEQVRDYARKRGLPLFDKRESQDICFVPDGEYAGLIRERRPDAFRPGRIVDRSGRELGRHDGIVNFTIGQRRGLGLAMGKPVYVTAIDAATDTVTIGPREELARSELRASKVHWLIDPPTEIIEADVQIRYTHKAARAVVEPTGADRVHVRFREPQYAITPGQAAVFYDGDVVLGGGWIDAE